MGHTQAWGGTTVSLLIYSDVDAAFKNALMPADGEKPVETNMGDRGNAEDPFGHQWIGDPRRGRRKPSPTRMKERSSKQKQSELA
jgi:uncharacterized glyoxalase superfamily protein PhnB